MSTLTPESDFFREFEEFQHKNAAAIRLTWFALLDETEKVLRVAFFPFAYKGRTSARPENTDEIMWIKDADDPHRWRPIKGRKIAQQGSPKNKKQAMDRAKARGENQQLMISLGLDYYLFDVLLARMIPHVRRHWKEVAALTRRYSSSDLLLAEVHWAPEPITANQHRLSSLCEFWGRPKFAAEFKTRFREVFVREFEKLRSEIELESKSELTLTEKGCSSESDPALTHAESPRMLEFRSPERPRQSSARQADLKKLLIAKIKSQNETEADRIAVLMDEAIEKMPTRDQSKCAPLPKWGTRAPGLRTWKEFLDHEATHDRVRNYINKVPPLSSEISRKAN